MKILDIGDSAYEVPKWPTLRKRLILNYEKNEAENFYQDCKLVIEHNNKGVIECEESFINGLATLIKIDPKNFYDITEQRLNKIFGIDLIPIEMICDCIKTHAQQIRFAIKDKKQIEIASIRDEPKTRIHVDKNNYDENIGTETCMNKIKDKVWFLLGFLLQTAKNGVK